MNDRRYGSEMTEEEITHLAQEELDGLPGDIKEKRKFVNVPLNQATLLQEYKAAMKELKPKNLGTILELREQFKARGMAI